MTGNTCSRVKLLKNLFKKNFFDKNKVTGKVKDFKKLSNKEIYLSAFNIFNSSKYNKTFKFILWPNFLEEHHILSPDIRSKTFCGWLEKCPAG